MSKRFLVTKLAGTVNTVTASATVDWASGDKFPANLAGKQITIAGVTRGIASVASGIQLTVDAPIVAGATGAAYSIALY